MSSASAHSPPISSRSPSSLLPPFSPLFDAHKASPTPAMPLAYSLPSNVSPATVTNTSSLLRIISLALISGAAIASRLFAVINFESIIHELCVLLSFDYLAYTKERPHTVTHGLTSKCRKVS